MAYVPTQWTATNINVFELDTPIAKAFGWTFFEHPTLGDEHPVLAVTLDRIGDNGPIVWDTHEMDVPEYM